jgi:hypothetical protein
MPIPIEIVAAEAASHGLRVERIPVRSKRDIFDKRRLLIEGKRCQVIPSQIGHPNVNYPQAEYFPLYLPRTEWPDFLIYVTPDEICPVFHVILRAEMSKDTGRTPETLERYREAWDLLRQQPPESLKKFETVSWQLEVIRSLAQKVGLEVEFIKTKKHRNGRRWPPVIKRRVLIADKKCAVFSATRISKNPEKAQYNYAVFKVPDEEWPDFQLYVVRCVDEPSYVFVVPRGHIDTTTSASLDHSELARYKNAWDLLTATNEILAVIPQIRWQEPTISNE